MRFGGGWAPEASEFIKNFQKIKENPQFFEKFHELREFFILKSQLL